MKLLYIYFLVFASIFLSIPAGAQTHASLHSVDIGMPPSEFERTLVKRGFQCETSDTPVLRMSICFEPFSAGTAFQAYAPMLPMIDPILEPIEKDKKITSAAQADLLVEILEASQSALKSLKYIVRVEREENVTIFYSCSVFTSCDHEMNKIVEALTEQTHMNEVAIVSNEPTIISDFTTVFETEDAYSIPFFDQMKSHIRLLPALAPCIYGESNTEEVCVYNGTLLISLPKAYIASSIVTNSKSAARLVVGIPIDLGIISVSSKSTRGNKLDFN